LRGWAEDLLDPNQVRAQGWFDADTVERRWRQHLSGQRDSTPALWAILMFQSWLAFERQDILAAHVAVSASRPTRVLSV